MVKADDATAECDVESRKPYTFYETGKQRAYCWTHKYDFVFSKPATRCPRGETASGPWKNAYIDDLRSIASDCADGSPDWYAEAYREVSVQLNAAADYIERLLQQLEARQKAEAKLAALHLTDRMESLHYLLDAFEVVIAQSEYGDRRAQKARDLAALRSVRHLLADLR